jgi:hypothetical protein
MSQKTATAVVAATIIAVGVAAKLGSDEVARLALEKAEAPRIEAAREHIVKASAKNEAPTSTGPRTCACSTGTDCLQLMQPIPEAGRKGGWAPALTGNTIGAGKWRGDGCIPKACTGNDWPTECPKE